MRTANWRRMPPQSTRWRMNFTPARNTGLMGKRRSVRDDMFTGIIEETGTIEGIKPTARAIKLVVRLDLCGRGLKVGDSLAVNGCCLTVAKLVRQSRRRLAQFDLLKETWRRTNLQFAKRSSLVNLERPLRSDGRLGGHFV